MTTCFRISTAALALGLACPASALVYDVDLAVGDGTVVGTVETDGSFGILADGNIVDFSLVLTSANLPTTPILVDDANGDVFIEGDSVVATETEIRFDFIPGNAIVFGAMLVPAPFYCISDGPFCLFEGFTGQIVGTSGAAGNLAAEAEVLSQPFVFATRSEAVVPLPGALPLALSGLAAIGFLARRRG